MPCNDKNPLIREGTSTYSRVLAALSTGYAKVDERDTADLLLFAKRYAAYLNHFNPENAKDDDWQPLMKMDASVILATLNNIDVQKISDYKKLLYKRMTVAASDADARKEFKFLFDLLFSLISLIDEQYRLLPAEFEYKGIIGDIIQKKLRLPAANLVKCFSDYQHRPAPLPPLLDYSGSESDGDAPLLITTNKKFKLGHLTPKWHGTAANPGITVPSFPDSKSTIVYIINHNLFNAQTEMLLNGIAGLVKRSSALFDETIENFPKHTPHYGLFISFVKLFRFAQDHLNDYTRRHLDFYYKEVLQLTNKKPMPDTALLTFELQKPVQRELLKKGTLFNGEKDITGHEISYRLTDDVVLNKATIVKLQAQQIDLQSKKPLRTFPAVNSEDGKGAKLLSADQCWFTFGNPKSEETAKSGFAIASNILFLNEGKRDITITITFKDEIPGFETIDGKQIACFECLLTGKKDWLKKDVTAVYHHADSQIVYSIAITPNDPAIIPYTEKVHKENFETGLPLLKIYFNQDASDIIVYSTLCKQKIVQIDVDVDVRGVKDLMLSSDAGSVDASKPFKPFGEFPDTNASFYIGSKEIFQKQISELTINYADPGQINVSLFSNTVARSNTMVESMASVPGQETILFGSKFSDTSLDEAVIKYPGATSQVKNPSTGLFNASTMYLDKGVWQSFSELTGHVIKDIHFEPIAIDFTPNERLKATSLNGFLRLANTTDNSLTTYLHDIKTALDQTTLTPVEGNPSVYKLNVGQTPVPREIKITNFSVDYKAAAAILFSKPQSAPDNNLFYHITPFGYSKVQNDGNATHPKAEQTEKQSLLADVIYNGELYIGLENAEPDTVVTVLFQVADGSANPLKEMKPLGWFYLSNNEWVRFEKSAVADKTRNFTQSGIVTFTLPVDISNDNTLFQQGLYWIKAVIEKDLDTVCKMILIKAQAAGAELVQDENSEVEFRQSLPSGTISKLVESNGTLKTIAQPFDSFNGRTRESDEHFYVRVSERLRHKQRAVSIWDFEHIILEQFQTIYKVKCLNHTGFYNGDTDGVFCENYPGHVTIIPIPDIKNKTGVNFLRPYTPIGLLTNIQDYLKNLKSPFVKLQVVNPKFEEIRLMFKVKFSEDENIDVTFYRQTLNLEIERFLSPWAYQGGAEISFGGKISKSVLLNFVEERPYVDYITCFRMDHILERKGTIITSAHTDVEVAQASTSRSVLVSYLNEDENDETQNRHLIDIVISCDC